MIEDITSHRKRIFWTDAQDAQLVQLVEVYGIHSWPEVSSHFVGRDSKACSLRWRYFLAPHIVRSTEHKLSEWEIAVLVWAQRDYGNKWRNIAEDHLPWRSPNDLKNYWNQHVNGKQDHVRVQNKLLLQGLSLEALRQNPPPEVHARWQKVMAMRDSPKGCQPPAKKGTRGLSYIIRQAAKSQSQRGEATSNHGRASAIRKRRVDSCTDEPNCRDPTYCPLQDSGKQARLGPGAYAPNQATAAAAAGGGGSHDGGSAFSGSGEFYSSTPGPFTASGLPAAGSHGEPYSAMSFYTGCGSAQVDSSAAHPSISMPLEQQQAVHGLLPGPDSHMGFDAGLSTAAAAVAQGHSQPAGAFTWAPELDCSPNGYCSSDGSTGHVPYTPGSASSCGPQLDFAALQAMQQPINGPASTNRQAWSNSSGSSSTAAAAVAAHAGLAPAGAFGYHCGPVSMARAPAQDRLASFTANSSSTLYAAAGGSGSGSFTSSSPTGLRTSSMTGNSFTYPAAGGVPGSAGWQQLLPGCASGNSISSNSSGSFGVDPRAFHSPTNQAVVAQADAAPNAVALQEYTLAGVPAQLHVVNHEQQLQPHAPAGPQVHGTQQQQQQQILLLLFSQQQQQQQQVAAADLGSCPAAPGPVTATVAAAVPALAVAAVPEHDVKPSLGDMPSMALESFGTSDDFEGIADLFESDGQQFDDDTLGPDVLIVDVDGNEFDFDDMLDCAGVELGEGFDVSAAEVDTLKREFDVDW